MNKNQKEHLTAVGIAILMVLALLAYLAIVFPSCTTSHKATSDVQNNSQVKKTDSTAVSKSGSGTSNENTWFREWVAVGGRRDSFISKEVQLQPIYNTMPVEYRYREGGTSKAETWKFNVDSFKATLLDSMNKDKAKNMESSKTEVLSLWHIIGIAAGVCFVFLLLSKLKIGIR